MKLLKCNLCILPTPVKKNEAQSLIKLRTIESVFLYFILLVITLIPIFNHGCHSSPHTDEELCLDVFMVGNNPNANKNARPIKSGFVLNK